MLPFYFIYVSDGILFIIYIRFLSVVSIAIFIIILTIFVMNIILKTIKCKVHFFGVPDICFYSVKVIVPDFFSVEWLSRRTVLILIVICIFYSTMWCIGPVFGIGKYVTFEVGCTMAFSDDTLPGKYFVNCAFIFMFFLPLSKYVIVLKNIYLILYYMLNSFTGVPRKSSVRS